MGYVTFAYAGVPAFFLDRYDIGYAAFGLLMSATLLPFVLVQWPASRLVERATSTRLLLGATVAQGALALTLDFAPSYEVLLGLRFLWGIAAGTLLSVGATHVARLYEGTAASRQQGLYGGMLTLGERWAFSPRRGSSRRPTGRACTRWGRCSPSRPSGRCGSIGRTG
ncbi:MFS transporter [Haloarculaceae archaeon H-GB11]|nr:MFS transporter [Haloarculaceae archaeon H-GB11]